MDIINGFLDIPITVMDLIGIIFILYGVALSVVRIARIEISKHKHRFQEYENTKRILIQKVIFGLDFFVAADLLRLAIVQSVNEVFLIALIVGIRTILSWSLSKEVHLHEEGLN